MRRVWVTRAPCQHPHPPPPPPAVSRADTVSLDARAAAALPLVGITGLNQPTSFTWDVTGAVPIVVVAEKAGVIKIVRGWAGAANVVLLDISKNVASWGDHGLTR